MVFKSNNITFKYLKKGMPYYFEVHSVYEDNTTSEGSRSNTVSTASRSVPTSGLTMQQIHGKVDLRGATIVGGVTKYEFLRGDEFGQVRDLRIAVKSKDRRDIAVITWKSPVFEYNPNDYVVHNYRVEIRKEHHENVQQEVVKFEEHVTEYKIESRPLELGETYYVSVSTYYEEIDRDTVYASNAVRCKVLTRPRPPEIIQNKWDNEEIRVKWNAAKGAVHYTVSLYKEESTEPLRIFQTDKTFWNRKFDEDMGYGTSYYVKIASYSSDAQSNMMESNTQMIGGDYVPRYVYVVSNHEKVMDANTQAFLTWDEPKVIPESYKVISNPPTQEISNITETNCLFSGLKAGTNYIFKVMAVHKINDKTFTTGGCISNRIRTNPTPSQIKNIQVFRGKNPSTSILVKWVKVDVEKANEDTTYRVCITKGDDEPVMELTIVGKDHVTVEGLDHNTTYSVTVEGGNSEGYGKRSEKAVIKTALGNPKKVLLNPNNNSPSDSLILTYTPAEGDPTSYTAIFFEKRNEMEVCKVTNIFSGHVFKGLQTNTEYYAELKAIYGMDVGGAAISSVALTAPGKSEITYADCCLQDDVKSHKEIEAEWKSDHGCDSHEVKIIAGTHGTVECALMVLDKTKVKHTCENEGIQYSIKVRSKNQSGYFGYWSDEKIIHLAPTPIASVLAKQIDSAILVTCEKVANVSSYYVQPLCDGSEEGEIVDMQGDCMQCMYTPLIPAANYTFLVWGRTARGVVGRKTLSNNVFSSPPPGEMDTVSLSASSSTDIDIAWKSQERCEMHEVSIRCANNTEPEQILRICGKSSCFYRCCRPGDTYYIKVRCLLPSVEGKWSKEMQIKLAPDKVELLESNSSNAPANFVNIKWRPLASLPAGYIVRLFCNEQEIDQCSGMITEHSFQNNLLPGLEYYCTVAAYNKDRIFGKPVTSKMYPILWRLPQFFNVRLDENNPSKRAIIDWEKPPGVDCFRLEIENHNSGYTRTLPLVKNHYSFDRGIPGNSYSLRLFCGSHSQYASECMEAPMIFVPGKVKNLASHLSKGDLVFEWTPPDITPDTYKIEWRKDDGDISVESTEEPRFRFSNPEAGHSYSARVAAVNTAGISSMTSWEKIEAVINPPSSIKVNPSGRNLVVDFQYESTHDVFEVTAVPHSDSGKSVSVNTDQYKCILRDLLQGESYTVSVVAIKSGMQSKRAYYEGTAITYPGAIKNFKAINNGGSVVFQWDPADIKPHNYKVEWRCNHGPISEESTSVPHFRIELLQGIMYSARVAAVNAAGHGDMTDWANIVPAERCGDHSRETNKKIQSHSNITCEKELVQVGDHKNLLVNYQDRMKKGSQVFHGIKRGACKDEPIVIKFIKDCTETNKREVENLESSTRHEHVVKYFASGFCKYKGKQKAIFIAMEECDSKTLHDRIKNSELVWSHTKCKFDMLGIAKGLGYIHGLDILHRDLKPHNLLYKGDIIVISDFGLSKKLTEGKSNTKQSMQNIGTDGWRAPETYEPNGVISKESDIFSAGLVFFYMLTKGKHPFGDNPHCWNSNITYGERRDLTALDAVPDGQIAKDLITKMLNHKSHDRPSSGYVLSHPFFWDERRKLEFYTDVMKYIHEFLKESAKQEDETATSFTLDDPENDTYSEVCCGNWIDHLAFTSEELEKIQTRFRVKEIGVDVNELSMKEKAKKFNGKSVCELVRFIRNRYAHDHEDKGARHFDMTIEEFWEFFSTRFPHLFIYVFSKLENQFKDKRPSEKDHTYTLARYFYK